MMRLKSCSYILWQIKTATKYNYNFPLFLHAWHIKPPLMIVASMKHLQIQTKKATCRLPFFIKMF